MKRILVTGATGMVGSYFLDYIRDKDLEVYAVARKAPRSSKKVNWITLDFDSPWRLSDLPDKVDVIVHLAQTEHFRDFPDRAVEIFNVNTLSTLRLADYALAVGAEKIIYASSAGIYGSGNEHFKENRGIIYEDELGFYLGTKHCSEVILGNYAGLITVIVFRFFFVYGQNQRRTMLIPRLVDNVKNEQAVFLQGTEGIRISLTHALDAARYIFKSFVLKESQKINVAGPESLSIKEIAEIIGNKVGKTPRYAINEQGSSKNIVGDTAKLIRLLGAPQIKFTDGVNDLL